MPTLPRFDLRALATDAVRFASAFPAIASRLARPVSDPSTERLVRGSHYLAGTVLEKIDDYQVHAHEALAQRVSPWLRRPMPSATVVVFDPEVAGPSLAIPRATALASAPLSGVSCTFRPVGSIHLAAYRVRTSSLETRPGRPPILELTLESSADGPVNVAVSRGVALYVDGELENALELVHSLTSRLERATVSSGDWPEALHLSSADITRGGLASDESLAPDPDGPDSAFSVLTEAFVCPHRFRFVRVRGLEGCAEAKPTRAITLRFALRESLSPSARVGADQFRAHCATVANVFEASADPMALDTERGAVPIRVAGLPPSAASVYAVQAAWATSTGGEHGPLPLPDIRRLGAGRRTPESPAAFAVALERFSDGDPTATISFSRLAARDNVERTVSLSLLATNAGHAARLRAGDLAGTVNVEGRRVRFRNVVPSSPYVAPPMGRAFTRRIVRLGAVPEGRRDLLGSLKDALFLAVPSWTGSPESARALHLRIDGLRAFEVSRGRRVMATGATQHGYAYCLTVDESAFRGVGDLSLFGAALGEALSRATPLNTFAELTLVGAKTGFRAVYTRSLR